VHNAGRGIPVAKATAAVHGAGVAGTWLPQVLVAAAVALPHALVACICRACCPESCDHSAAGPPQLVLGELFTGSNFDDGAGRIVGGRRRRALRTKPRHHARPRPAIPTLPLTLTLSQPSPTRARGRHGFGAKLANIFSERFEVETADAAAGVRYSQAPLRSHPPLQRRPLDLARRCVLPQVWRRNMSVVEPPELLPLPHSAASDYTRALTLPLPLTLTTPTPLTTRARRRGPPPDTAARDSHQLPSAGA